MTSTDLNRTPAVAEIAKDMVVAVVSRSAEFDPEKVTERNTRNQVDLMLLIYEKVLRKVKELGIE